MAKLILRVLGIGFVTNLIWEIAQMPLYKGFGPLREHFWICFFASLGDALIIFLLYAILAIFRKDLFWIKAIKRKDVVLLLVFGALIGIGIEKWALATGEWQYASTMPIFRGINVGLLPVLQMMLLPLLTFYLSARFVKIFSNH